MIRTASATMAAATGSRGVLLLMFCKPEETAYTHYTCITHYTQAALNTEAAVLMLKQHIHSVSVFNTGCYACKTMIIFDLHLFPSDQVSNCTTYALESIELLALNRFVPRSRIALSFKFSCLQKLML